MFPGPQTAVGATFAGTPGIVLGHNSHIAWGVTNTGADVQDLFVVNETVLASLNLTITTRTETFNVAHGAAVQKEIRTIDGYVPHADRCIVLPMRMSDL
jgi:penicillin amidase